MPVQLDHPAVAAYLARLEALAAVLPPHRAAELVADIRAHFAEALARVGEDDVDGVRDVIDRLGDPEDIVAAEAESGSAGPAPFAVPSGPASPATPEGWAAGDGLKDSDARPGPWGPLEIAAVLLMTVGHFVLVGLGPVIGLVCAWLSPRWSRREKWVATALTAVPLVVLAVGALFFIGSSSMVSEPAPAPQPYVSGQPLPEPSAASQPPTSTGLVVPDPPVTRKPPGGTP